MELRQYFTLFLKWLWLILLTTILAAAAAFGVSRRTTPIYRATTTLWINEAKNPNMSDYTSLLTSERLASTYSKLLTRRPILEETRRRLGLEADPKGDEVLGQISVQVIRDTQLLELSVQHPNPQLAVQIADTIPKVFIAQNETLQQSRYAASKETLAAQLATVDADVKAVQKALEQARSASPPDTAEVSRLESTLAQYRSSYASLLKSYEDIRLAEAGTLDNLVVVEPPQLPERPISPRTLTNTLLAAVVGAMLGVGTAFLIEYLDDTIKMPEEVERAMGLTTLGAITQIEGIKEPIDGLITSTHPKSPVAEAYRVLRTNLQFASVGSSLPTLMVTSAGAGEGKTTTLANLGVALAQAGKRVILVDTDLRRPSLHKFFGLPNSIGLTSMLLDENLAVRDAIVHTDVPNLSLLCSGPRPPNPAELLEHPRLDQIIAALQGEADAVLFDSPPLLAVADATILSRKVQGVLLVVEMARTRTEMCRRAVEALRQVEAKLLGVIMNKISKQRGSYYYYYYYHYYDSGDGEKTVRKRRRSQRPLHRFFPLNLFKRASKPTVASPQAGPQQEGPA